MQQNHRAGFRRWLTERHALYGDLTAAACKIVEGALREQGIPCLTVMGRTKTIQSALTKARNKEYSDPQKEMTDITGIRVITFTQTDADRACELVRNIFSVDKKR